MTDRSPLVYEVARSEARAIRESTNPSFPTKVEPLLGKLGFTIYIDSMVNELYSVVESYPKDAIHGVVINANLSSPRYRFQLAHAAGHIVERQHTRVDTFSFIDSVNKKTDVHDFFADEFAMAYTMPADVLHQKLSEGFSAVSASVFFGVPVEIVRTWVRRLVLRPVPTLSFEQFKNI